MLRFPVLFCVFVFFTFIHSAEGRAICQNINSDPDGDGYGWENDSTCIVDGSATEAALTNLEHTLCSSTDVDPDGDGWGWENNASCKVQVAVVETNLQETTTTSNVSVSSSSDLYVSEGGSTTLDLSLDSSIYDLSSVYVDTQASNGGTAALYGAILYQHWEGLALTDSFSYRVADYSGVISSPRWISVSIGSVGTSFSEAVDNTSSVANSIASNSTDSSASSTDSGTAGSSDVTLVNTSDNSYSWWKPSASENLKWQLQLQGDIRVISGVDVYAADVTASQGSINAAKGTGAKLKCYISAGSAENWRSDFYSIPSHVLGNAYQNWPGEWWLDTRDISALAPVMRARMDACKSKGFDAIDADNVNGFENDTGFNLSRQDSIQFIQWLADEAHARGLAFSLKNSESIIDDVVDSVDMLQTESCYIYSNCWNASKMSARNKAVFAVEYQDAIDSSSFIQSVCSSVSGYNFSTIYRDRALTPWGVYQSCN